MKVKRKIIEINDELCNGCGQCVPSCAEGAIQIIDGKARLVAEKYCDGLGACLGECPTGALKITERMADDFDAASVQEYLNHQESREAHQVKAGETRQPRQEASLACGCPSTHLESFGQSGSGPGDSHPACQCADTASGLSHWPVQIRLVPPSAPFLKEADLLVTADCAAVAYPDLHRDFLSGRAVLMGCPKFDQAEEYIRKFTAIFQTAKIKRITILMMEVPCCSGLSIIVERGLAAAGVTIPVERIRVSSRGEILDRKASAD
ncbi:MAG: 4Fe-4S binding protein [bacterium]